MFGNLGSLWVCLGHLGPLRAFAGLFKGNPRSFLSQGPRKAGASMQFRAFRATRLSFEQPAAFRATSQNFEQPAPQFRAFRAHDRSGPDWPVWQQFQVPGSVSRFCAVLGSGALEIRGIRRIRKLQRTIPHEVRRVVVGFLSLRLLDTSYGHQPMLCTFRRNQTELLHMSEHTNEVE